jgi:hypothetical protein
VISVSFQAPVYHIGRPVMQYMYVGPVGSTVIYSINGYPRSHSCQINVLGSDPNGHNYVCLIMPVCLKVPQVHVGYVEVLNAFISSNSSNDKTSRSCKYFEVEPL